MTIEEVADAMFEMVKEYQGKKKLNARALTKAMTQKFGDECDRDMCKASIRILMDSGRCVYATYGGASFIELPPNEEI